MKKKQHRKDKYGHIGLISVALCLSTIFFFFIRNHLLTMNNYFIDVEDSEQVYEIIASEFIIAETTKTEVENALADGIFGDLECNYLQFEEGVHTIDSRIVCEALGTTRLLFPHYYQMSLGFKENILMEIEIDIFTPDATAFAKSFDT